jgi:hypothetical protein
MILVGKAIKDQVCPWKKYGRRWTGILEEDVM